MDIFKIKMRNFCTAYIQFDRLCLFTTGYIQEKTLFQTNSLMPHLRRRINDDVFYAPPPYRILKNMLMAPGMLSGYSFYRSKTDESGAGQC